MMETLPRKTLINQIKKTIIVSKLDNISTQTGHSRNKLIGVFLEYAIENCRVEEK